MAGTLTLDPFDARILDLGELREAGTPDELERVGRELAELL